VQTRALCFTRYSGNICAGGGKFYHQKTFMIVNKQHAKNYKNRLNRVVVIVHQSWRVFLNHSVYMYIITHANRHFALYIYNNFCWLYALSSI